VSTELPVGTAIAPPNPNTAYEIITDAYFDAGLLGEGETPNGEQIATALRRLNKYINYLTTQGLKLWLQQDLVVPLTPGVGRYVLGPNGNVPMVKPRRVIEGYFVDNRPWLAQADHLTWLNAALQPVQWQNASQQNVFWQTARTTYGSLISHPLAGNLPLPEARTPWGVSVPAALSTMSTHTMATWPGQSVVHDNVRSAEFQLLPWTDRSRINQVRRPLILMSRNEWNTLSTITQWGTVTSYFPDKQQDAIYVNLWLVPDIVASRGEVHLVIDAQVGNFTKITDTMNFPPEWALALEWGLAYQICRGQPTTIVQECMQNAERYRIDLENFDVEDSSTLFQPDQRGQWAGRRFN